MRKRARELARVVIVVPCYNEEQRLDCERFLAFAARHPEVRFLMVDDGSTDGTARLLEEMARACQTVELMRLPRNLRKAEAVRQGVLRAVAAGGDYIGYWDADLATPLEAILQLRDVLEGDPQIDMVMGSRVQLLGRTVERRPARHYLGRVFATFASLALALPVYDTQCGAKLFRNTPRLPQLFTPFVSNWVFDVEIIARLKRLHRDCSLSPLEECLFEFPLFVWREVGGSKLKTRACIRAAFDLYRIWRYVAKP